MDRVSHTAAVVISEGVRDKRQYNWESCALPTKSPKEHLKLVFPTDQVERP